MTAQDVIDRVAELSAMQRLHELVGRLLLKTNLNEALDEVLDAAVELTGADMGSVQLFDPRRQVLHIAAHCGFEPSLLDDFREIDLDHPSACGKAGFLHERIIVEDVNADAVFEPLRPIADAAGFRALQSTPLLSRSGNLLGVLSTHFPEPHRCTPLQLRTLDLYARQAADFIERVRMEEQLRESEAKYRDLFDSIDEGFCTFDMIFDDAGKPVDYRFIECNSAFERHTGLKCAAGQTIRELLPDQDHQWFEIYGRVAMTGEPIRVTRYGEAFKRWFEIYAFRTGPPEQRRVAALFSDVTVRKDAELALRASQQRQAYLLKLADALRPLADPTPIRAEASRILGEHLGVNRAAYAEVDGNEWVIENTYEHDVEPQAEGRHGIAQFGQWIIDVLRAGKPLVVRDLHADERFEPSQRAVHEAYHILAAVAVPLVKDGDLVAVLGVYSTAPRDWSEHEIALVKETADRTWAAVEQARAEAALRETAEALRIADRRKDEFLAMLSHELRNPLAAISSAAQVFRISDPREVPNWLPQLIGNQVKNLTRMIDDLMDISRVTRGKVKLRREPLELSPVVHRAAGAVRELVAEREHELTVRCADEPLWVEADATRLEQILINLLNNAAKYTEPGGQIFLDVQREQSEIVIRVKDTGIGLTAEALSQVFEMFAQVDASIDRSRGGLGIGLTLVKSLVEMHGGSVSAASEGLGCGTEFTVRLSALDWSAGEDSSAESTPRSSTTARKVLVVDDNEAAAKALGLLLSNLGHDVREVHDGPAALEVFRTDRPEVVLLDIGLPGMDGYQVAGAMRANQEDRDLLLIAVSGYGQEEDRQRSGEAGFDHHLVKPVEFGELVELMTQSESGREMDGGRRGGENTFT